MNQLPIEIIQEILEYCSIDAILRVGLTNSYYRGIIQSNTIWRSLLRKLKRFNRFPGNIEQPQMAYRELYTLSKTNFYDWIYLVTSADFASSTDNPQQSVANVLVDDTRFWSSAGSPDVNSNEEIVLSLVGLSIVSWIGIKPYRAAYQALSPIYAPQAVQVFVGVNYKNWVEIPIVFPVENTHNLQTLDISEYFTVGDSLKLVLQKRQKQQIEDGLWYTVLEKVNVYGIPLSESTPYLSSMIIKECEILNETPRFGKDFQMSYSQAVSVIESFGSDMKGLFDYVVQTPPNGAFRNSEILPIIWKGFGGSTTQFFSRNQLKYFELLEGTRTGHPWTDFESMEFIKIIIHASKAELIWRFFGAEVQLTEEIGDLVFTVDPELALAIYSERSCMDKILKCLLHLDSLRQAFSLLSVARYPQSHYLQVMRQMSLDKSKKFAKVWIDHSPSVWQVVADALGVSNLNSLESLKEWLNS